MAKIPSSQILPPKEMSNFKRLIKFYDQKQYKNGLRFANSILSNPKYSEHGETLAMKAIILNSIGKREEAYEFIKRGLKANIQSFVCWHIYGLIKKSDMKHEESIKCYLQALKLDPNNIQVLRDLSILQMQMRNFEGARATRLQLLKLRPSMKIFWFGYAVTLHLIGQQEQAVRLLDEYMKAALDEYQPYCFETSEIILYQVMILNEAGQFERALQYLENNKNKIVDNASYFEYKADLMIKMNRLLEAQAIVWDLIDRNPECVDYFYLLSRAKGLSTSKTLLFTPNSLSCFEEALTKFPHSKALKRLMLPLYSGENFVSKADEFIRSHLRKGVPALFELLKPLYDDLEKVSQLENLYHSYDRNLKSRSSLGSEPDDIIEPPSTFAWFYFLLSHHYNYIGKSHEALDIIRENLPLTPTLIEFYVLSAECYQNLGDFITASRWAEEGQSLDTADRYLNALCTRSMLKAHRLSDAELMASQFTHGKPSAVEYLSEMQCMWFLQETAQAYWEQGQLGLALKFCQLIHRHFDAIVHDQLDFHAYTLRKVTLRAYVKTLRLGDHIRNHKAYYETAKIAIMIYIHLHEHPNAGDAENNSKLFEDSDKNRSQVSAEDIAEAKRRKTKERKAAHKAEQEAQRNKADQEKREKPKNQPKETDKDADNEKNIIGLDDPAIDPKKLIKPDNALDEAMKFVSPLVEEFGDKIDTHCYAFEVYDRKDRFVLMFRAIKRALALPKATDHPMLHQCIIRMLLRIKELWNKNESNLSPLQDESGSEEQHNMMWSLVKEQFEELFFEKNREPPYYNEQFFNRNKDCFLSNIHYIICKIHINPSECGKLISTLPLPDKKKWPNLSWKDAWTGYKVLVNCQDDEKIGALPSEFLLKFRKTCATLFPDSTVFLDEAEQQKLRLKVSKEAAEAKKRNNSSSFLVLYTKESSEIELSAGVAEVQLEDNLPNSQYQSSTAPVLNGIAGKPHKKGNLKVK